MDVIWIGRMYYVNNHGMDCCFTRIIFHSDECLDVIITAYVVHKSCLVLVYDYN